MKEIYIVTMERSGDREGHHYSFGAYSCLAKAAIDGLIHERHRANKYEARIELVEIDSNSLIKEIPKTVYKDFAAMKFPEQFDDRKNVKDIES